MFNKKFSIYEPTHNLGYDQKWLFHEVRKLVMPSIPIKLFSVYSYDQKTLSFKFDNDLFTAFEMSGVVQGHLWVVLPYIWVHHLIQVFLIWKRKFLEITIYNTSDGPD